MLLQRLQHGDAAARRLRASSPIGHLAAAAFMGAQRIGVDDVGQRAEPAAAASDLHVVGRLAHADAAPVALLAAAQIAARPLEPSAGRAGAAAAAKADHGRRALWWPIAARARLVL